MTDTGCADAGERIAGWYGKLPFLGDFASRRLPREFTTPWDAWLRRSIAGSRERLQERWLEVFVRSPMWRFAIGPNVCGDRPWTGLLLPSVDKVGRYFPLTFAAHVPASTLSSAMANEAWYADLEAIALSALHVDFTVAALEDELQANPLTFDVSRARSARVPELEDWLQSPAPQPLTRRFPGPEALASAIHGSATSPAESMAGRSLWWWVEYDSGATHLHCTAGLPDDEHYSLLLEAVPESRATELRQ